MLPLERGKVGHELHRGGRGFSLSRSGPGDHSQRQEPLLSVLSRGGRFRGKKGSLYRLTRGRHSLETSSTEKKRGQNQSGQLWEGERFRSAHNEARGGTKGSKS